MKTLVALDESLLAVMLRALVKYQATAINNGEVALVVEAARQIQVALDMLAMVEERGAEMIDFLHFVAGGTFLGLVLVAPFLCFARVRAPIRAYWQRDPVRAVADLWMFCFSLGVASLLFAVLIALHFNL